MRILIIEDEKKLADILKKALTSERYSVDLAFEGEEGLDMGLKNNYALILLDIMLPKRDGLEICRELRARYIHTPIIMITARTTETDRVLGLDQGADDYMTKPFAIGELLARMRAVLRRRKTTDPLVLKIGDLTLDAKKHEVTRAGKIVSLTPKEYKLLFVLLRSAGEAQTRRQLLDSAWSLAFLETKNHELNVHMRYLRSKIDGKSSKPLIHTVRGVGYILKE
ncbi:MAG: response regulator transcription factor [bacterium]|nr:response regulator transcription factor [bacterium]